MAIVKKADCAYRDTSGEVQALKVTFEVNPQGEFFAVMPDFLEDNLKAVSREYRSHVTRPVKHLRVSSEGLAHLEAVIRRALSDYSAPEVKRELVICYAASTRAAIWQCADGSFVPNGYFSKGNDDGNWVKFREDLSATNRAAGGYSALIGARVYTKVTTARGAHVSVTMEPVTGNDQGDPAARLNSFTCFDLYGKTWVGGWSAKVEEMPYSAAAADFFYNMMLGMATLCANIDGFFADKPRLEKAIASGGHPFLLGNNHDN